MDDFIFAGARATNDCLFLMAAFQEICKELGVPIADQKTVWPTPVLEFLGLEIDTINMVVRIPLDKLFDLKDKITQVLGRKKASLKELESLDGKMNFVQEPFPRQGLLYDVCMMQWPVLKSLLI